MSDSFELAIGIALLIACVGSLLALRPRNGKPYLWVTKPFVGPSVAVVIVVGAAVGAVLLASYFTTVDNLTLSGTVS